MADFNLESSPSGSDFFAESTLTFLIPLATDFQLEQALEETDGTVEAALSSIECRESLFFDECVDVHFVLKVPAVPEEILRPSLRRVSLALEAQVINTGTGAGALDRDGHRSSEIIYSGTVEHGQEPAILAVDDSVVVTWKLPVVLARPRMRLQRPAVAFTASGSWEAAERTLAGRNPRYLPSGVPSGMNLLEAFSDDPALNGVSPRLSALRVSRVAPVIQQAKDGLRPIKSTTKHVTLAVNAALHSRVRFARPTAPPTNAAMIAMLEMDFTPYFDCEIVLTSISLSVQEASIRDWNAESGISLPISCVAHDHVTFLYHITPSDVALLSRHLPQELGISIEAVAMVQPGICTPKLTMAWTTNLDFTLPVNPGFGSAMQPIQRSHRPSQLSINTITSPTAPSVSRPDSIPSLESVLRSRKETAMPDMGITMTFQAPAWPEKIYPGKVFVWTIHVVNRSPATSSKAARKLAIIAMPKRRSKDSRVSQAEATSHPATVTHGSRPKTPRDRSVADAVLDENVVHAMQRSSTVESAEVVCLTADLRVGPLAPGACHVTELRLMALKTGIVSIEAVRVVDLATTEHVDVHELPTIFVEEPREEGEGAEATDRLPVAATA